MPNVIESSSPSFGQMIRFLKVENIDLGDEVIAEVDIYNNIRCEQCSNLFFRKPTGTNPL